MDWQSGMVMRVLALITSRHGNIRLGEVAHTEKQSTSRLRHELVRHTGKNYRTTCLDAKLAYGAELLRTTMRSIPDIADLLGYNEQSKFRTAFKARYGVTPTQYRARQLYTNVPGSERAATHL